MMHNLLGNSLSDVELTIGEIMQELHDTDESSDSEEEDSGIFCMNEHCYRLYQN